MKSRFFGSFQFSVFGFQREGLNRQGAKGQRGIFSSRETRNKKQETSIPRCLAAWRFLLPLALILCAGSVQAQTPAPVSPENEPVVQAVAKTLPLVVNISTQGQVSQRVSDFFGSVYVVPREVGSLGSGLLVSTDGYIVTNHHVVEYGDKLKISVALTDGSTFKAKFITSDPDKDLALIQIVNEEKKTFPCIDLKNLSPNLLGETVIALGNPIGYQSSVSMGILSAKDRKVKTEEGTLEGLLQTDAAINPGNSGGPLVDINGKFVGLNSAKAGGRAVEGIGFSIPAVTVVAWVQDAIAIAKGEKKAPKVATPSEIMRQRFGITLQEMTPELAEAFGFSQVAGMIITDVEEGSPAAKAKIERGMLLVRIGDAAIYGESSFPRDINRVKSGDNVVLTVSIVQSRAGFVMQRSGQVQLTAR
jgi:S1-C subfamily serine protease